jgi:hypothetical protein
MNVFVDFEFMEGKIMFLGLKIETLCLVPEVTAPYRGDWMLMIDTEYIAIHTVIEIR